MTPPNKFDTKHKVRIAIGNGLRPEIWDQFQTRFHIPEIGEFYGATEGNSALVNHCVTKEDQGCVGRAGFVLRKLMGMKIVRYNVEEDEVGVVVVSLWIRSLKTFLYTMEDVFL